MKLIKMVQELGFEVCDYEDGTYCIHQGGDVIDSCENKKQLQSALVWLIRSHIETRDYH
jgi:hypothetical protein